MKTYLHMWHHPIYNELYKDSTEVEATLLSNLDNFVSKSIIPLSQSSEKAKKFTHAVCKMIARDIHFVSFVDDI